MSWGGFNKAELEWQYNPRETVPDFADHLQRFVEQSAKVYADLDHIADIRFGPGTKETMDVFPAAHPAGSGDAKAPVHVFFHGGYWRSQDKRDFAFVVRDLVEAGFIVVLANYDLCPDVRVAEITDQAVRCITHVYQNVEDWGGDRDNISLSGHSAGGQIVARLASHDWQCEIGDANPFVAIVPISGIFDLEPLRYTSINDDITLSPEEAAANSPLLDIAPVDLKMMLVVGGDETPEFVRQSEAYAAYCARAGGKVAVRKAWGANHFTVLEELFGKRGSLFGSLLRFIEP